MSRSRIALFLLDALIISLAFSLAFELRFDGNLPGQFRDVLPGLMGLTLVVRLFWHALFGLYTRVWIHASVPDLIGIAGAVTAGTLTLQTLNLLVPAIVIPRYVLVIDWLLNMLAIGGVRLAIRLRHQLFHRFHRDQRSHHHARRVLIVGAGAAGAMVAREMLTNPNEGMIPVGFVDDDRRKTGLSISGVRVLGDRSAIPRLVKAYNVDRIVIALPSARRVDIRSIVEICRTTGVDLGILPAVHELVGGKVSVSHIRKVDIEDLLRREPIETDVKTIAGYLTNHVVMITGAGGSIGSELCRQVAAFRPARLILVGHGENSLFAIESELRQRFPACNLTVLVADIRDRARIAGIMKAHAPDVIFHAAAHKHVPLMEANPSEAVTNNVLGTRNLIELAQANGVDRFVLVSTDKAVNPTNVMGCSKRLAELMVQAANGGSSTRFSAVRFGNVLGSRGSVIPVWQQQVRAGGPVTVTHPDMRRYFITIPEAVQLVVQAGAIGRGGEIFVLEMGEAVRIVDLAREFIRLSGLEPGKDIEIEITGVRPGEKLFEELATDRETVLPTQHPKILQLCSQPIDKELVWHAVDFLAHLVEQGDEERLVQTLKYLTVGDADLPAAYQMLVQEGRIGLRQVAAASDNQAGTSS